MLNLYWRLKEQNTSSVGQEAALVQAKSKGYLTHPDHNLFIILRYLETCFEKHANSNDVFELTYNEFFNNKFELKFSCSMHKVEMLTNIFSYYITMRMRQYTYLENQKT